MTTAALVFLNNSIISSCNLILILNLTLILTWVLILILRHRPSTPHRSRRVQSSQSERGLILLAFLSFVIITHKLKLGRHVFCLRLATREHRRLHLHFDLGGKRIGGRCVGSFSKLATAQLPAQFTAIFHTFPHLPIYGGPLLIECGGLGQAAQIRLHQRRLLRL